MHSLSIDVWDGGKNIAKMGLWKNICPYGFEDEFPFVICLQKL
jgi:hypothetical protein